MLRITMVFLMLLSLQSCKNQNQTIDLQGHRGARGILPENTIPGFIKALEIGVTTLEMDVVISKDNKVVVSHEPFFSHEIAITPKGEIITLENEQQHNIYQLPYEEIKKYDVGIKPHERFPLQQKMPVHKPLLIDVINEAENYTTKNNLKKPYYNIEIKRNSEFDTIYHPAVKEFVTLVLEQINMSQIANRICIQSFDIETLQMVKQMEPQLTLALLVENEKSLDQNIKNLGFTPQVYSPYVTLVNQKLVDNCKKQNMLLIPWTVNTQEEILEMIQFQVDGIITDYPDKLKSVLDSLNISVF
ncbi:glycerophosphodiester phosphodiesterase family protein [Bizionia arctica]|nr:glycerophosphodiester phosphodiesterase family protein [Bizionia arctica]